MISGDDALLERTGRRDDPFQEELGACLRARLLVIAQSFELMRAEEERPGCDRDHGFALSPSTAPLSEYRNNS